MSAGGAWRRPRMKVYDYNQELARAGFADMLHDAERNKLYR